MGRKRIFDSGGQHETERFTLHLLTGDIKLYVLPADHEDNDQGVDRMMCVHMFADDAESVTLTRTITNKRTGTVFGMELCKVCEAMHTPSSYQRGEYDFRKALVQIMDDPEASA